MVHPLNQMMGYLIRLQDGQQSSVALIISHTKQTPLQNKLLKSPRRTLHGILASLKACEHSHIYIGQVKSHPSYLGVSLPFCTSHSILPNQDQCG